MEEKNEHLDDSVRYFADRMDHWLLGVSRGRWFDPPAADFRSDLAHTAFCHGQKRRLTANLLQSRP